MDSNLVHPMLYMLEYFSLIYIYIYMYVCMYACMHVCLYGSQRDSPDVYMGIQRESKSLYSKEAKT